MEPWKALEALFPGSRHAILRVVYLEPERWWTVLELAARIDMEPSRLRRQSAALAAGGVLSERRDGGFWAWRANPEFPFFREIQAMVAKCAGRRGRAGGETILVVEDEPATAKISRILLESWGYKVLVANKPPDALRLFDEHRDEISLLLTDVIMPEMDGRELAEQLRAVCPGLRVLFMSGCSDRDLGENLAFLPKPFNPAGLARKIREELDR